LAEGGCAGVGSSGAVIGMDCKEIRCKNS